jgi:hypothetical protein
MVGRAHPTGKINMSQGVAEALAFLKGLGTPAELSALAAKGYAPVAPLKVNAHIHLPPNFSAFTTVAQAIDLAAAQGIGVLGVSNYYDFEVYADFVGGARKAGIFPLFGLEIISLIDELVKAGVKINDPGNPGKMYICGKGITWLAPFNAEAQRLIGIIRRNDSTRIAEVVRKLSDIFAQRGVPLGLTESAVIDMVVKRHGCPPARVYLQERHVCQAFQEAFFAKVPAGERMEKLARVLGLSAAPKFGPDEAVKIQNEIRAQLMKAGKPAYVDETFVNFEQAYRLILELGGIPAYPTLADGTIPICPFEDPVEKLVENIKGRGFQCAEFIPIRNTPEVLSKYVKAMRAAGLVVTAGTEHNTLDLLPIEPTCVKSIPVPEDVKAIFWEGACVVAAHQFLTLHGKCGFVDSTGKPNPEYSSTEARIGAFKALGAAVIQRYRESK